MPRKKHKTTEDKSFTAAYQKIRDVLPRKKKKRRKKKSPHVCEVCEQPLGLTGGYSGTGLCGPCCTGEAETAEEKYETW